jgi:hypothetical protein
MSYFKANHSIVKQLFEYFIILAMKKLGGAGVFFEIFGCS